MTTFLVRPTFSLHLTNLNVLEPDTYKKPLVARTLSDIFLFAIIAQNGHDSLENAVWASGEAGHRHLVVAILGNILFNSLYWRWCQDTNWQSDFFFYFPFLWNGSEQYDRYCPCSRKLNTLQRILWPICHYNVLKNFWPHKKINYPYEW